ncbi:hypothetical protein [Muricauda sp. MAR_2010_75]|uniref:hypothetical protein n=1 Tax=Allomuricauda sp. MAR_2010_75 TaxID=1250232 RepID=UPI0005634739|nr:hypothetical protein [Muricauda sp. MAR_2010_75]
MAIYDKSELEGLNGASLQQMANEIQQRFAQKRSYFHQIRNSPFITNDNWNELNKKIVEFDTTQFKAWNQQWSNVSRQQNLNSYINHFDKGVEIFGELEDLVNDISPKFEHSESVEALKEEILTKVDNDINSLASEIKKQVEDGIQDLVALKAEYKLQDTFAESVKAQKTNSEKQKNRFFNLFVSSVILIPLMVLSSFLIPKVNDLEIWFQWSIRLLVSITLGILSVFLYNQYKIYHLIHLKYSHLYNFIGGGATFVAELVGLEESLKKEFNKKVANMFIDIDDILMSIRKAKHPSENLSETSSKTLDSVMKNVTELAKAINKST